MKTFILLLFFPMASYANGPLFQHKDTFSQQEFENVYQDIRNSKSSALFFNVKDYGAGGDGIKDDSSAFQATNDAIVNSGKSGVLFIPAGTYKLRTGIRVNVSYVSMIGSSSQLDFSSLTAGTTAITVIGGANTYFGNPYFNADKEFRDFTLLGTLLGTASTGIWFQTSAEPGPSHLKFYNVNIQGFQNAEVIGDNSYLLSFYGCDIWISSIAVTMPQATNSGERIYFSGCTFFNNVTHFKLDNGIGDVYINGCSLDGASGDYIRMTAGDLHVDQTHIEGNFCPDHCTSHVLSVPQGSSVYPHINDSFIIIKGTRTVAAFELNGTAYFHLTNSHVNSSGGASSAIIISSFGAAGFIDTKGTINTTADAMVTNNSNMNYWQDTDNANSVLSNRQIISPGTITNDNAALTYVGESSACFVGAGAALTLSNNQYGDICSVLLSSGDWDLTGNVQFSGNVTGTDYGAGYGTVAGNDSTGIVFGQTAVQSATSPTTSADNGLTTPRHRISISANTRYYLKDLGSFSVGTLKAYGSLEARRPR